MNIPAAQPPIIKETVIRSARIGAADLPNGGKMLQFLMPTGEVIAIPLDTNGVEAVIQALRGTGISVARANGIAL